MLKRNFLVQVVVLTYNTGLNQSYFESPLDGGMNVLFQFSGQNLLCQYLEGNSTPFQFFSLCICNISVHSTTVSTSLEIFMVLQIHWRPQVTSE